MHVVSANPLAITCRTRFKSLAIMLVAVASSALVVARTISKSESGRYNRIGQAGRETRLVGVAARGGVTSPVRAAALEHPSRLPPCDLSNQ